jgi:hypothetical protein
MGGYLLIDRDRLPEDAADWSNVIIEFPRLRDNSAGSCPRKERDIFQYVSTESADLEKSDRKRFRFLRTARVKTQRFWLWEYVERDGVRNFVLIQTDAKGNTRLSINEANGLSPEQFILAAYYDEIYWS